MIPKYRNRGIIQCVGAAVLMALMVVCVRKSMQDIDPETGRFMEYGNWGLYGMGCYIGSMILWSLASVSIARAKGYDSERIARIFVILFVLGFCCGPLPLIFPFLGFFAKDKMGSRKRRRRRSDA